jgi:hypothetical protein
VRVTKGALFLAFPCDEAAREVDRRLFKLYQFFKVPTPEWLAEHQRYHLPDSKVVRELLTAEKVAWREVSGERSLTHFIVSLLISSKALNALWSMIFRNRPNRVLRMGSIPLLHGEPHYRLLWVVKPLK